MSTSRGTWKAVERKVAKLLKGRRNPLSGGSSGHTRGDVIHRDFYVEIKYRKRWAIWKIWEDTRLKARAEDKLPLVVIKQKGKHGELVLLSLQDFVKLVGINEVS